MPSEKNKKPTRNEFVSLYLTLMNGGRKQRIEWMKMLREEQRICLECKKSQSPCDQQYIKCRACVSRKINCPRDANFLRDAIMEKLSISRKTYIKCLNYIIGDESAHQDLSGDALSNSAPKIETQGEPSEANREEPKVEDGFDNSSDNDDNLEQDLVSMHSRLLKRIRASRELKKQLQSKDTMLLDAQTRLEDMQQRLDATELSLKQALASESDQIALEDRFRTVLESTFASSTHINAIQTLVLKLITDLKGHRLEDDVLLQRLADVANELGELATSSLNSQDDRDDYLSWIQEISRAHPMIRTSRKGKGKRSVPDHNIESDLRRKSKTRRSLNKAEKRSEEAQE